MNEMTGFIILYVVTVAVILWLWALTQSQCNNTFDKMKEGFNIFKDALIKHTELDKAVEERVSKLEEKIEAQEKRTVIGYESPLTFVGREQQKEDDSYDAPLCIKRIVVIPNSKPEETNNGNT